MKQDPILRIRDGKTTPEKKEVTMRKVMCGKNGGKSRSIRRNSKERKHMSSISNSKRKNDKNTKNNHRKGRNWKSRDEGKKKRSSSNSEKKSANASRKSLTSGK